MNAMVALPLGGLLPILRSALLLVFTVLLLNAAGPDLVRRSRAVRYRPAGSWLVLVLVVACLAGAVALALLWHPSAFAALLVLCAVPAWCARLSSAPADSSIGRTDAARAVTMIGRLAALAATPSQVLVARLAHRLALRTGADPDEAEELRAAAMLYDIGRLGLPDALLNGCDPLDAAEQRLLRRLPAIGARLLGGGQTRLLDRAAEVALCHQESWDGSGYPRGLSGQQIPLSARIVAIAAVFDTLLAGSPGVAPQRPAQAARYLEREAGRSLDPDLTRLFLDDLPAMAQLHEAAPEGRAGSTFVDPVSDTAPAEAAALLPAARILGVASGLSAVGHRSGSTFA